MAIGDCRGCGKAPGKETLQTNVAKLQIIAREPASSAPGWGELAMRLNYFVFIMSQHSTDVSGYLQLFKANEINRNPFSPDYETFLLHKKGTGGNLTHQL